MKKTGTHTLQVMATIGVAGDKHPFLLSNGAVKEMMLTLKILCNSLWTGQGFYSGEDTTFTSAESGIENPNRKSRERGGWVRRQKLDR